MPIRHLRSAAIQTEIKALWRLAWPVLIGQLATVGLGVTDVAMAGHASAEDLAGVSLGVSIWHLLMITLTGALLSVNPVVSQLYGAQALGRIPHVVRQAMWKALGLGVLAMLAANVATVVFDHMQLEPAVRTLAINFVRITSTAFPAFCLYRVLYGYSTSINQTKPMMVIAVLALLISIVLNSLLVFGLFGLPRLGGQGCAWATVACVWFDLGAILWWVRRAPAYRSTQPLRQWEWPEWREIRGLLKLGLPIGVTFFAESSAFSLVALLVAGFGATVVAAHQVALSFTSLVFMLPMSLGVALLTRVGQALGAQDAHAARMRAWVGVGMALALSAGAALGIALFNTVIANAYTSDAGVAALAAHLLLFAAVFQLSDGTQVAVASAVRAYKVTRLPMFIHMFSFWGICLPLGCVLGLAPEWLPWKPAVPMAAQGFWTALVVGLTVAAVSLWLLLGRVSRQRLLAAAGPR
ncbi:MATE family efflux transporter [Variovorax sp. HJSM1_2]|uniref:MATE family efflux transporter n=1 Tax=Variovorax sp. HJSM1_2 TaxID=3366263 RepID=UPI003BCEA12E